jgi:hypothetical protein
MNEVTFRFYAGEDVMDVSHDKHMLDSRIVANGQPTTTVRIVGTFDGDRYDFREYEFTIRRVR